MDLGQVGGLGGGLDLGDFGRKCGFLGEMGPRSGTGGVQQRPGAWGVCVNGRSGSYVGVEHGYRGRRGRSRGARGAGVGDLCGPGSG